MDQDRIYHASHLFLTALLDGNLKSVIQAVFDFFQMPVFVINSVGKFVCFVPDGPIGNARWDSFIEKRESTLENCMASQNFYKQHVKDGSNVVYLDTRKGYSGTPCIMGQFYENGIIAGHIGILTPSDYTLNACDLEIVEIVCSIITRMYSQNIPHFTNIERTVFFQNLLRGQNNMTDQNVELFILRSDPFLKGGYLVLLAPVPAQFINTSLHLNVCERITNDYEHVIATIFDNNLVLICSHLSQHTCESPYSSEFINNLINFLYSYGFVVGISSGFSDIQRLKAHYEQAKLTVAVGMALQEKKRSYSFQEYAPLQLLYPLSLATSPEVFLHPVVNTMQEYDHVYNTEYLKTYRAYLFCGQNKRSAAESLHIHPNTLNYRLDKIDELFHCCHLSANEYIHLFCSMVLTILLPSFSSSSDALPRGT